MVSFMPLQVYTGGTDWVGTSMLRRETYLLAMNGTQTIQALAGRYDLSIPKLNRN
jgi:hypothetical protein